MNEQVKEIADLTEEGKRQEQRIHDDQKMIENLEGYKTRMEAELEVLKAKLANAEAAAVNSGQ